MKKLLLFFLIGGVTGVALINIMQRLHLYPFASFTVLADGARYDGDFVNGVFEGQGIMVWPNGDRYAGSFKGGQFHGQGRLDFSSGNVYAGEFTNGSLTGSGTLRYANGDRYTGVLKFGRAHGTGLLESSSGRYAGGFRDDRYYGQGNLTDKQGNTYTGGFEDGKFHGQGVYKMADGRTYTGEFVAGDFSGTGIYTDAEGTQYEGGFEDWVFHGTGSLQDRNGDQYQGQFVRGDLTGAGEYIGKDGVRYEGDFQHGLFNGHGKLQTVGGDLYEGEFRYGAYHGEGTLKYAHPVDNVTSLKGTWRNGEMIESADKVRLLDNGSLAESALYTQQELLRKAWQGLRDNDPDAIDMYFLGIAGDGKQEVFRREVLYVQDYFDRVLGTSGKSLSLVNGRHTVQDLPLATATSIKQTLQQITKRMDPVQDILFIFMTSHGSSEFEFTLDQTGLDIPDLPVGKLAGILAAVPLRWKVLVISACYSGGFIPALANDHTLIITAASADRTSFGCSDRAEFTYFGEAFFKEALPLSRDFAEAFDRARGIVSTREQKENEKNSNPQIHRPDAILGHLRQWRTDLRVTPELAAGRTD